jgi:hypothetical protein
VLLVRVEQLDAVTFWRLVADAENANSGNSDEEAEASQGDGEETPDETASGLPENDNKDDAALKPRALEAHERFSMDKMLENMRLLPALNPGLFDSLVKSQGFSSLAGDIIARAGLNDPAFIKAITPDFGNLLGSQLRDAFGYQTSALLSGIDWSRLTSLSANTLSPVEYFQENDEEDYAYSEEMTSPASYFEQDEVVIESFEALNGAISRLIKKNPHLPLVWRGQQDADWGLQSGLYLALQRQNGVLPPSEYPKGEQRFPTETQMQDAESKLIAYARENWRLDGMPAMELLARLQHYGAPTRLLDVTRNPYIAVWFAIEHHEKTNHADARLFALATRPVPRKGQEALVSETDTNVRMSDFPELPLPFWHYWLPGEQRQEADWGTGSKRRLWVPPAYDPRIVAQNAAFVLDGVPIVTTKATRSFPRGESGESWGKVTFWSLHPSMRKLTIPTESLNRTGLISRRLSRTASLRTQRRKSETY